MVEFEQFPARIRDKAEKFYWKKIKVFDSKHHTLTQYIEDRTEAAQVLRAAEILGELHERKQFLNADERKCLDGLGSEIVK